MAALVNWGGQNGFEKIKESVVVIVPKGQPETRTKLEQICAKHPEIAKLETKSDDETFFTINARPGMGRQGFECLLGDEFAQQLFVDSPAGRFELS